MKTKSLKSKKLFLDFETYSPLDISKGSYEYCHHKDFKILCGYANDQRIKNKKHLIDLCKKHKVIVAHNAVFEASILKTLLPSKVFKDLKFICTATMSSFLGGPRSLMDCSIFWGLSEYKYFEGKALIKFFNDELNKPEPFKGLDKEFVEEQKKKHYEYCKQDVHVTMRLFKKLVKEIKEYGIEKDFKKEMRYLNDTIKINFRGVPIDKEYNDKLVEIATKFKDKATKSFNKKYPFNPASSKQTLEWINNPDIKSASKTNIRKNWNKLNKEQQEMFLHKWAMLSPQVKRVYRIKDLCDITDRLRNSLMPFGAVTGRYTSRGICMLNFPKGKALEIDDADSFIKKHKLNSGEKLKLSLRGLISAKNKYLIASDLRQIEFRLLMWDLGYNKILKDLEEGGDIYLDFAEKVYGKRPSKDSKKRQIAKVIVLSLGYGSSVYGMYDRLSSQIEGITYKEVEKAYKVYHKMFKNVNRKKALFDKNLKNGIIHFTLPNGAKRFYADKSKKGTNIREAYKQTKIGWAKANIYGGLLMGLFYQSFAREVIFEKQSALLREGFSVVFNVYDEIVVETDNKEDAKRVHEIMEQPLSWAKGLPIQAETKVLRRYGA